MLLKGLYFFREVLDLLLDDVILRLRRGTLGRVDTAWLMLLTRWSLVLVENYHVQVAFRHRYVLSYYLNYRA